MKIKRFEIYSYAHLLSGIKIDNYSKDEFYGKNRKFRFALCLGKFSVVIQLWNNNL